MMKTVASIKDILNFLYENINSDNSVEEIEEVVGMPLELPQLPSEGK